jgi:hypothetical protein
MIGVPTWVDICPPESEASRWLAQSRGTFVQSAGSKKVPRYPTLFSKLGRFGAVAKENLLTESKTKFQMGNR